MGTSLENALERLSGQIRVVSGSGIDMSTTVDVCPICKGLGMVSRGVAYGHPDFGKLFACPHPDCQTNAKRIRLVQEKRLSDAALPPAYRDLTLESFMQLPDSMREGKMLATAMAYLFVESGYWVSRKMAYEMCNKVWSEPDEVKNSIVLQGDYGVGKTGVAAAIVNGVSSRGGFPLYIRTQDFITEVQMRYGGGTSDDIRPEAVIQTAKDAQVLILDEFNLAGSTASGNRQEIIESVLRHRHSHEKATIVTCNFNQNELRHYWGDRAIDVLMEMAHYVPMGGAKLRKTDTHISTDYDDIF